MKQNATLKTLLLAIAVIFVTTVTNAQTNLGVGTATPDASAKLDVTSTNQGILVPRMTTTARTSIATPAKGLMVYDSTIKAFYYHDGTAWGQVGGGLHTQTGNSGKVLTTNGTTASWANAPGVKTELIVSKTTGTQTLSNANGTNTGDLITFDNVITTPTIGSYSTSTNTYTVGTGGAGLYLIQARLANIDNATAGSTLGVFSWISVNGSAIASASSVMSTYLTSSPTNLPANAKGIGFTLTQLVYLNDADNIKIYGLAANSSIPATAMKTDGFCKLYVVKLN